MGSEGISMSETYLPCPKCENDVFHLIREDDDKWVFRCTKCTKHDVYFLVPKTRPIKVRILGGQAK